MKVKNLLRQGSYAGLMVIHTDLAEKSEIKLRVNAIIEGMTSVNPRTLMVGKLAEQQPVRSAKITVAGNNNKPFKITKLSYDTNLVRISQEPIPNHTGFSLEVTPHVENVPPGNRKQTILTIETDLDPEEKSEVQIHVLNVGGAS